MIELDIYKIDKNSASIKQCSVKREWMDQTAEKHAYHCFPVSLANSFGYEISFDEEISFEWNGISNYSDNNVKIYSGIKYASASRGNSTISFNTNLIF